MLFLTVSVVQIAAIVSVLILLDKKRKKTNSPTIVKFIFWAFITIVLIGVLIGWHFVIGWET